MCSMCIGGLYVCSYAWATQMDVERWSEMAMCKPCVLTGVFAIFGFLALSIILGPFVSCVHCCLYVWPCASICLVMYRCTGGPNSPCVACVKVVFFDIWRPPCRGASFGDVGAWLPAACRSVW